MMKMSFNVTAKKLFGVKYERLARTLFLDLVVFWGLHISGLQVKIAPAILYLMTVAFSAGVMWQALSSGDNRANLENMFMLPFEGRSLILSYVAALGAYTLLTKTIGLLAVVWAVARWSRAEILGSILCALTAIVVVSCLYPLRLGRTDAYAYYVQPKSRRRTVKVHRRYSVRRYLFRYLMAHKNYLINTVAMWGVACVLPLLLGQMEARFVLPIGCAVPARAAKGILYSLLPVHFRVQSDRGHHFPVWLAVPDRWGCPAARFDSGCFRPAERGRLRPAGVVLSHPGVEN